MNDHALSPLLATLVERLSDRESLELEFKAARGGIPSDLWPTVSAFANTSGGWIILGVDEQQDPPAIQGVANVDHILHNFHSLVRNESKISEPVCGAHDVAVERVDGKDVVVIRVPAAPRKARPVYVGGNPYRGTYLRRHSGDYQCSKPEVDRMMREASDVAADSAIIRHFGMDDLDESTVAAYRRRYQTLNPASPRNNFDDRQFLESVGGFGRNRETGESGVTVAGLLLLGKHEALREWRTRHLIDYRLVSGAAETETRWDDRVVWEGNLLGAFEAIYPRLVAGQPIPFRLEGFSRVDESSVHIALREAFVNLLVHADYSETQPSLIIRSSDEYRFRNPGSSRVQEADLLIGNRSDPRNPILGQMFRYIGLVEEAGTGIPKIVQAWSKLGLRFPSINIGTERYEFELVLRHAHLLSEEDRHWLRSLGSEWDETEQLALVVARHDGHIDNVTLRRLTGKHPADITKVLSGLRARGLLQMFGGGRGAWYQLGPAAGVDGVASLSLTQETLPAIALMPERSDVSLEDSGANPQGPQVSLEDSGANPQGPQVSLEDSPHRSGDLGARLFDIARPVRERVHIEPAILSAVLVDLCAISPLSVHELADLLRRSEAHLREVLRTLIADGRIGYLYPDSPSHPRQKYRAT